MSDSVERTSSWEAGHRQPAIWAGVATFVALAAALIPAPLVLGPQAAEGWYVAGSVAMVAVLVSSVMVAAAPRRPDTTSHSAICAGTAMAVATVALTAVGVGSLRVEPLSEDGPRTLWLAGGALAAVGFLAIAVMHSRRWPHWSPLAATAAGLALGGLVAWAVVSLPIQNQRDSIGSALVPVMVAVVLLAAAALLGRQGISAHVMPQLWFAVAALMVALAVLVGGRSPATDALPMLVAFGLGIVAAVLVFRAVVLDIVDRAADQLEAAARRAALGDVAGSVGHEISNGVTGLLGYLGYLRRKVGDPELEAYLERSLVELDRIGRLSRGLVVFMGEGERHAPEVVDVRHTVTTVLDLMARDLDRARVAVEIRVPEGTRAVARPDELQQAVLNLLLNARDACSEQRRPGTVVVAVETVGGSAPDAGLVFSVTDDGPGVPPEVAHRIFTPGVTTKGARGSGIGLSTARNSLREMGGDLALDAGHSPGAKFLITLRSPDGRSHGGASP